MINFRVPDWVIFSALFFNVWLICFSIIFGDMFGVLLGVFCVSCFIFTYRINLQERYEKEKIKKNDKEPPLR